MNTPPIAPPTKPDLRALLDSSMQQTLARCNCHEVGSIVSFDAATQTASVQLQVLAVLPDGSQVPYPVLTDCPIFVNSGGGGIITFPIAAGDPCLVLFNDRDLDNWWATGNVVAPNSPRMHSLSDGLVLVGFRNKSNSISDYSTTQAEMRFAGAKVVVRSDNSAALLSSDGALIDVSDKVKLANSGDDLRSILHDMNQKLNLFADFFAFTWTDTAGNSASAASRSALIGFEGDFIAFRNRVDALLKS